MKGNLSHIHSLLSTLLNKRNPEDLAKILEKITCSSKSIVDYCDIEKYMDKGLISNLMEGYETHDLAIKVQYKSDCIVNNYRCCKRGKNGELVCRAPNYSLNRFMKGEYEHINVDVNHPNALKEVLMKLKLLRIENENEIYHEKLQAGKYLYPAYPGEHMIPTYSDIFALTKSSQNIQVTNLYLEARYLAKYLRQHDANVKVHLKANELNRNIELEFENLYNTKITGSRIETEKLQMKRKDYHDPKAYCLSITQGITIIFGYETEKTNNKYVKIPTLPLQERLAIKINRKKKQIKNNDGNMNVLRSEDIDPNKERIELQFEPLRQFDDDEIDIIKDV